MKIDLVIVHHNERNQAQAAELMDAVRVHEPAGGIRLLVVSNQVRNRGFAAACNLGAFHPRATAPLIGFINPDAKISGPFCDQVSSTIDGDIVITGCRYGKSQEELRIWGVQDWVCGAAFFVDRAWFTAVGGFDTRFVWGFEETDLIRRAEADGKHARSILLPISHSSPESDTPQDVAYKREHFGKSTREYFRKWGR